MGIEEDVANARERIAALEAERNDDAAHIAQLEATIATLSNENMATRLLSLEAVFAAAMADEDAADAAEDADDAEQAAEDADDAAEDAAEEADNADADLEDAEDLGPEQGSAAGSDAGEESDDRSPERLPEPDHWYWRRIGG